MKPTPLIYRDLYGDELSLDALDAAEKKLIASIQEKFEAHPDWNDFDNYWQTEVAAAYKARGLSRPEMRQTAAYRIAADLSSRLAITDGLARMPDYRDELDDLIRSRFRTRRAFCQATGLSEDMLSHVFAKRKQLAIDTLATALAKVGFALRIVPVHAAHSDPVAAP